MKKNKVEPMTLKDYMLKDKNLLYVVLFIVLNFAVVIIDAAVLGKFCLTKSAAITIFIVGIILNVLICFMTLYTITLSYSTQVLLINKFEHLQKAEDRYKLTSYVTINEMRSYVYTLAIISVFMGSIYLSSSEPIKISTFFILHVFGYFVITKPLRQPEFFVDFLSDEYYLLLSRCYYKKRKKDKLSAIKEVLK